MTKAFNILLFVGKLVHQYEHNHFCVPQTRLGAP